MNGVVRWIALSASAVVTGLLPSQAPAAQTTTYRWTPVTINAAFAPRDGAGAVVFQDAMWLLGGWNPGDKEHFPRICNNEVWRSEDGRDWTLVKPNTFLDDTFDPASDWEGRHTAGYANYRGKLWILGGDANQGHYQNDVWNSADGKTWTRVADTVPWAPRVLHMTAVFQDKIWVMGGQTLPQFGDKETPRTPADPGVFHRDIWTTTDGVHWEEVTPEEPYWSARGMVGGSAVLNGRLWILGGGTYDTPGFPDRNFYNDVWSTADGVKWTCHTEAAPWQPRQYHEVAAFDGKLWVLEGYDGAGGDARVGNRNDVWYSADGATWHEVPDTPWKPRHAASVFVYQDGLWMVAGNNMEPDVWVLRRD